MACTILTRPQSCYISRLNYSGSTIATRGCCGAGDDIGAGESSSDLMMEVVDRQVAVFFRGISKIEKDQMKMDPEGLKEESK